MTRDEAIELISSNLKRMMAAKDVGVRDLARRADTYPVTVSRLVNQQSLPSPEVLYRIAHSLGVRLDDLFRKKTEGHQKNQR